PSYLRRIGNDLIPEPRIVLAQAGNRPVVYFHAPDRLVINNSRPSVAGSFLHKLKDEERIQRLNVIVELSRSFLPDVRSIDEIKNVILRLWAGCMSASKEIAPSTKSGPNTPARRTMIFSQQIDILCQTDPIYEAGVEAAPSFKRLRGEVYSFEGVPQNSPVKRYPP
ncbi:MAG: hypothetical protein M3Y53_10025, partial [Thermoproteota archaeon]|nr:hypothetical protein [Thermoproteota archaeon]